MANTVITPTHVLRKVGTRLTNSLRFVGAVSKDYNSEFKKGGAKVGTVVNARLPQRYVVNKGAAFIPQATANSIVPIEITDQANTGIEFDSFTMTLSVDDYEKRYIDPAGEALANQVDFDGLDRSYKDVYWTVGTPAVVPGSTGTLPQAASNVYMDATTKLANYGVMGKKTAMLSPAMHQYLVTAHMTLFAPAASVGKQYKTGQFSDEALGIQEWMMDQNVPTHTIGALGGTPTVTTAPTSGATTVVTQAWTSAIATRLKRGDVVQFALCNAVNPMNRQSTGQLQDFVVTADCDSDGAGALTIPISPAIITSGPNQTVDAAPLASAAVTIFSHASNHASKQTKQGLVFTEEAFAMVTADLEKPMGVWASERISNKAVGVAIRFVKDYNIMTDQSPARLDTIYGFKTVRPEMAVRICS